jgi:hypothetical protein
MRIILNQKGYTLLLTLLLVVIVSGFIGTLTFLTINQQKQVEKTDEQFLLSDISDMGIEHYRARILNDYVAKAVDVQQRIKDYSINNDLTEEELTAYATQAELSGIGELIHTYKNYVLDKTPLNSNESENFSLKSIDVTENNNLLITINLVSSVENEAETLQAIYRLPLNLVNFEIKSGGNGDGSGGDLVELPDFSKTTPNPFPPKDTDYCLNNLNFVLSGVSCKVWINSLPYLIWNSNIYISDIFGFDINFIYLANPNYKNSNFYVNANNFSYLDNNISNVSIFTEGYFEIKNSSNNIDVFTLSNILFQSTEGMSFESGVTLEQAKIFSKQDASFEELTGNDVTFYSAQNTYFNDSTSLSNSFLRTKGSVYANKTITLDSSYFLFEGNKNEINSLTVRGNSKVCFQNQTDVSSLNIIENGNVYVQNKIDIKQYQSGSKMVEFLKPQEFKAMCEQSSGTSPEIDVDIDTTIEIGEVLEDVEYDIIN